jgi:integral membrane protein TIGR01906
MEVCTESRGAARFFRALLAAVACALLIIGLLIASIEMFAVNTAFFESEYAKLGTAADIGISEEGLAQVTRKLLNYTTGKENSLDMQANIQGETQEVFGGREKAHMVDVKALYLSARSVRAGSLIGAAVLAIAAFVIGRKRTLKTLCKSFLWVSGGFLLVVGAITAYAAIDFQDFWTSFHHVFFAGNDLWQLDLRTDVLIQMVPLQFFSDLVARIIIRFASIFLTLNIAAEAGLHVIRKRERGMKTAAQGA